MGSIESFPRSRGLAPPPDAWRVQPAGAGPLRIRETRLEDLAALRALQKRAAPHLAPWSARQLESQRQAFPEGQLVAVCDGEVVGAASHLVVSWPRFGAQPSWNEVTADGYFTTHDDGGETLFAAALWVDASRRGFGAGRALFQARRRLCRRLNLRRLFATSRLPGYHLAQGVTPEAWAMRVVSGDVPDAALRFQLSQGFQYCGILRDFRPEDVESGGHAALLAWLNPLFSPSGPPAFEESERPRKCA